MEYSCVTYYAFVTMGWESERQVDYSTKQDTFWSQM